MSVPQYKRGEGKFNVLVEANLLAVHSIQIVSNPNTFDQKYHSAMGNDLIETSKDIFISAYTGNEIKVENKGQALERLRLIEHSILYCDRLLALIQLAKKLYHLDSKRVKFWGEKTLSVKESLKKWYQSECKRYRDILSR